jgi:hypothetical protein
MITKHHDNIFLEFLFSNAGSVLISNLRYLIINTSFGFIENLLLIDQNICIFIFPFVLEFLSSKSVF